MPSIHAVRHWLKTRMALMNLNIPSALRLSLHRMALTSKVSDNWSADIIGINNTVEFSAFEL